MNTAELKASLKVWTARHAYRRRKHAFYHSKSKRPAEERKALAMKWHKLVQEAEWHVSRRRKQIAAKEALRLRAFKVAEGLIGTMEKGGNNAGPMVSKIIRANGGVGPEPWCGDFCAYAYRLAGSKAVTRSWASVRMLGGLAGIKRVSEPLRGDLVRFKFDHVGIFDRDNGDGTIMVVEGNTGASGAVSDSSTGGDGVYRKKRAKHLVTDYLRIAR